MEKYTLLDFEKRTSGEAPTESVDFYLKLRLRTCEIVIPTLPTKILRRTDFLRDAFDKSRGLYNSHLCQTCLSNEFETFSLVMDFQHPAFSRPRVGAPIRRLLGPDYSLRSDTVRSSFAALLQKAPSLPYR